MGAKVFSHVLLEFERGRRAYRSEAAKPPQPTDDQQGTPAEAYWLGYMLERGLRLQRRWAVQDALGVPRD